jgi:hypothetical protein
VSRHATCAGSTAIAAVPVQAKDGAAKGVVSGAGGVAGGPGEWEGVVDAGGGGGGCLRSCTLPLSWGLCFKSNRLGVGVRGSIKIGERENSQKGFTGNLRSEHLCSQC